MNQELFSNLFYYLLMFQEAFPLFQKDMFVLSVQILKLEIKELKAF